MERNYDVTKENRISGHFNGLGLKPVPPSPAHHLNPDIHHMCGCSGKMNSAGEYMVRKFIAHAWDEPSGASVEVEVEGRSSPTPQALFPLYWEEQSPRIFKWALRKTSRPPQSHHISDLSTSVARFSKSVQGHQHNLNVV